MAPSEAAPACQDAPACGPEPSPAEGDAEGAPAPGAASVPRCAFCGGGPSGLPSEEVLRLAQAAVRQRKGSQHLRLALGPERGFLGPLLGPLSEKFGLAGVWVHRECAIWSPEVYFADSGHLKNVAAAVRRGRLLRCVFCGRNGPTMGCWVERCPKSYHLTCARAAGCYFHHEDYLITCLEHSAPYRKKHRLATAGGQPPPKQAQPWPLPLRLEEPAPPPEPLGRSKRPRRAAAMVAEQRISARQDAEREAAGGGDLAGDEAEFLRRERRRLQRDLARIAPLRLGGDASAGSSGGVAAPGWESVAGLRHVVDCLKEMVVFPLLYPTAFAQLGGSPPRGVLLHGHPGTGKTLVARALAGACSRGAHQVAFFARKGADCLGKYVGDAERQLRLLFQCAAASAPSIIFFDELDGLAPARAGPAQEQTYASVTATLLALMDATTPRGAVTVIGATNRPDALDPALRRPGRFDREIYFPLPSLSDRGAILRVHTAAWLPPPLPATLRAVAQATPGYAGADLAALAAQAALAGLKRTLPGGPWVAPPDRSTLPPVHVCARDWGKALAAAPSPASRRSCLALLSAPPCAGLPPVTVPLLGPPLVALLHYLHTHTLLLLPPRACAALDAAESASPLRVAAEAASLWDWAYPAERAALSALVAAGLVPLPGQPPQEKGIPLDASVGAAAVSGGGRTRILVSGAGDVGQDVLVGAVVALLEGGGGEVHTASLSSMLMAGQGEAHQGLSRILADARARGAAVLVMPQVESWAGVQVEAQGEEPGCSAPLVASVAWRLFLQQMGDAAASPSLVLATSHQPAAALPDLVVRFFGGPAPAAQSTTPPVPPQAGALAGLPQQGAPSLGAMPEPRSGSGRWQVQRRGGVGAVQCMCLEGGQPDAAVQGGMLHWAATSQAAQLAHAYALRSAAGKRKKAAAAEGGEKARPSGCADPLGEDAVDVGGGGRSGGESGLAGPLREGASGSDHAETEGQAVQEGDPMETDDGRGEAVSVGRGLSPAGGEAPPASDMCPNLKGGPLLAEERAVQGALRWCGQQLLRAARFADVRRACLEMAREKEVRSRAKERDADGSTSPALGEAEEGTPPPDPVPTRVEHPPSSGLVAIAHTACSGGFSSAVELVSAVGRVAAAVRRREEGAAARRRRVDGWRVDEDGYSPRIAAVCALQDSVAAWEYGMRGLEAAACTARRLAPPLQTSGAREEGHYSTSVGAGCKEAEGGNSRSGGGWAGTKEMTELEGKGDLSSGHGEAATSLGGSERQEEGPPAVGAARGELNGAQHGDESQGAEARSGACEGEAGRGAALAALPRVADADFPRGKQGECVATDCRQGEAAGGRREAGRASLSPAGERWAPECFAALVAAVRAKYAQDCLQRRERSTTKEAAWGDVERLMEGVAATHRQLQACLRPIGDLQADVALCSKCVQHEQASSAGGGEHRRHVCLQALTDRVVNGTRA